MKKNALIWMLFALALSGSEVTATVRLELIAPAEAQHVFFGPRRKIVLTLRNSGDEDFAAEIRARLYQMTSATAIVAGEVPWKKLRVLPGQTVIESAELDFPPVKSQTRFLVRWLTESNQIIGATEVWVYPTNMLAELKPLLGEGNLGVFDPTNELKPLLRVMRQSFTDLENTDLDTFAGKLAIFCQTPGEAERIRAMGKRNVGIVWLQPPPPRPEKPRPSFYAVPEKEIAIVIVQSNLMKNLPENPLAQRDLVYFCKMALAPKPLPFPYEP